MRKALVLATLCAASSAFAQLKIFVRKDGVTSVQGYKIVPTSKATITGGNGSDTGCVNGTGKFYSAIMVDPSGVTFPMPVTVVSTASLSIGVDYFVKPGQETTVACGSVDYLKLVVSKHAWTRKATGVGASGGRAWHGVTSDGANNMYTYGGSNSSFSATNTFYKLNGTSYAWSSLSSGKVGNRQHHAMSSDGSKVWLHAGSSGVGLTSDTWNYTISSNAWASCSCKKVGTNCPNSMQMQTMEWDSSRSYSVMFGGKFSGSGSNETWTLSNACVWTKKAPSTSPGERNRACMAYVPSHTNEDSTSITMNKVVLYGGQNNAGSSVKNDMWAWDGSTWSQITLTTGPGGLHQHTCAWDASESSNPRLLITGGYSDTSDTPSYKSYFCKFTSSSAATCEDETTPVPPGHETKPGAKAVYLPTTGLVYSYGGEENIGGSAVRYDTLDVNRIQ